MFFKKRSKENNEVQAKSNNEILTESNSGMQVVSNNYIEAKPTDEAQNGLADKVQVQSNIKVHSKSNNEVMNAALELFLEFGDCNKELMYSKMANVCTCMSGERAKRYEDLSREVRDNVFKIMEKLYLKEISEENVVQQIRSSYPFINDQNYKRLYSSGLYSAWKKHSK